MNLDNTEILVTAGTSQNGGARVWLESVSAGMRTVEAVIRELSQNDLPVLVVAEHGTGKAAAAARIHVLSRRVEEMFQVYQGGEASEQILTARDGQGGTIYLQEVGDLTAAAQRELIRQVALSGNRDAQRRVPRFICGTSRELEPEVKAGKFRDDALLWNQRSLFAAASFTAAERRYSRSAGLVSLGGGPRFLPCRASAQFRDAKLFPGI